MKTSVFNHLSLPHSSISGSPGNAFLARHSVVEKAEERCKNAAAWIVVISLLAASFAAAYLLWAKATGAWPLSQGI